MTSSKFSVVHDFRVFMLKAAACSSRLKDYSQAGKIYRWLLDNNRAIVRDLKQADLSEVPDLAWLTKRQCEPIPPRDLLVLRVLLFARKPSDNAMHLVIQSVAKSDLLDYGTSLLECVRLSLRHRLMWQCYLAALNSGVRLDAFQLIAELERRFSFEYAFRLMGAFAILDHSTQLAVAQRVAEQCRSSLLPANQRCSLLVSLANQLLLSGQIRKLSRFISANYGSDCEKLGPFLHLAAGRPIAALICYRKQFFDSVSQFLCSNTSSWSSDKVILPYGSLAGQLQESFFWILSTKETSLWPVLCDERLRPIIQRSIPHARVLTHRAGKALTSEPESYSDVPIHLRRVLDNQAYQALRGHRAYIFDYEKLMQTPLAQAQRRCGWLSPSTHLAAIFRDKLQQYNKPTIGFALGSVHKSPLRDRFEIDEALFCGLLLDSQECWVNLDPNLSVLECQRYAQRTGASVVHPGIDLFEDIDGVMALISVLDLVLVPHNNLAEMACALGKRGVVLSPTGICSAWMAPNFQGYLFSANLEFLALSDTLESSLFRIRQALADGLKASRRLN